MKNLHKWVAGLAVAYGLVSLIGGIIGYVSKGSLVSFVAGGIAAAVLFLGAARLPNQPKGSLNTLILISLILVGRFISAMGKSGPSTIGIVMVTGGAAVALAATLARFKLTPPVRPASNV